MSDKKKKEEANDASEEKKPLSIEELETIYETKLNDAANNANEILRRRLSGEDVPKSETENQGLVMKDLRQLESLIKMLKKQRQLKYPNDQSEGGEGESDLFKKVKTKENSVSAIVRKIS